MFRPVWSRVSVGKAATPWVVTQLKPRPVVDLSRPSNESERGNFSVSSYTHNNLRDEPKANAFSNQLKNLYRDISRLEMKLLANSGEPQDENRIVIKGGPSARANEAEKER
jgi:hypothetical protein